MEVAINCACPPKADGEPRHAGDTVVLRDRLSFQDAVAIRKAIAIVKIEDEGAGTADVLAVMSQHYLVAGIEAWTLVDAKGKPVAVERSAIRAFLEAVDANDAMTLVDAADALYSPAVLLPLVLRAQTSSPPSPTDGSTSATTDSRPTRPRPSKRSSTTTSPTGATGTITRLPVGDSSSSRNSASAR